MTHTWDQLEGASVAGKYGLRQWLSGDSTAAAYLTSFGSEEHPAILKLIPAGLSTSGRQLALWEKAARLSHPNLDPLLDYGHSTAGNESYLYAVTGCPDERLATALEQGPLSDSEAREILIAAVAALRYLHAQGFVHTAVDAAHIVAVGDRIKLSSDTLREVGTGGATPADDIRSLGFLLHQLLGRPALSSVPGALGAIIRRTTEPDPSRRWTLAEISAALDAPQASMEQLQIDGKAHPKPPIPLWPFAAAALVLVVVLFVIRQKAPPPASTAPPPASAPVAARAPAPAAPEPHAAAAPKPHAIWRVIAYTYASFGAAEKKARQINEKHPAMQAQVFAPRGRDRAPYLVALGGLMTHDAALRLQKQARASGLPRDTFVRNYSN
jgi:hypothetical protein